MKHEARDTRHGTRILVMAGIVVGAATALAMPSKQEINKAQPLVAELMTPAMDDYKAKKKTAAEVADAAVAFAAEAETEAAKFMLYRSSIPYYVRGEAYDKAAEAVTLLKSNVKDVPAEVVAEIISKATVRANKEKAPRLFELYRQAKMQVTAEKDVRELRKKPATAANRQKLAEALATTGDWPEALKEFANLRTDAALIAKKEQDGSGKSYELGEFWWGYKPTYANAEDTFKIHAVVHYRNALAAGEITGLKKPIVEQRIKEYEGAMEIADGKANSAWQVKGNTATLDLGKGEKIEFVKCPPGKYRMGFNETKDCLKSHSVTISRPFWMAKLPVTYGQADGIVGKVNRRECEKGKPSFKLDVLGGDNTPAALSYNQALEVLKRLNQECQTHLPQGYVFRMPSEAEYEYAAKTGRSDYDIKRDGKNEITHFKDRLRALRDKGFDAVDWEKFPWRVPYFAAGSKKANNWGLYDMFTAGWAYVLDSVKCKGETDVEALTPYYADGSVDPVQFENGEGKHLMGVVHGCGWGCSEVNYRDSDWVKFLVERGDAPHDDCFLRIVVGPDLVSEWKAKHGGKK